LEGRDRCKDDSLFKRGRSMREKDETFADRTSPPLTCAGTHFLPRKLNGAAAKSLEKKKRRHAPTTKTIDIGSLVHSRGQGEHQNYDMSIRGRKKRGIKRKILDAIVGTFLSRPERHGEENTLKSKKHKSIHLWCKKRRLPEREPESDVGDKIGGKNSRIEDDYRIDGAPEMCGAPDK